MSNKIFLAMVTNIKNGQADVPTTDGKSVRVKAGQFVEVGVITGLPCVLDRLETGKARVVLPSGARVWVEYRYDYQLQEVEEDAYA